MRTDVVSITGHRRSWPYPNALTCSNVIKHRFCRSERSVRDEVDVNTYRLFDLEREVPTDFYDLDQAVTDGFLSHHEALIKAPS
jgi:hypothetical protein